MCVLGRSEIPNWIKSHTHTLRPGLHTHCCRHASPFQEAACAKSAVQRQVQTGANRKWKSLQRTLWQRTSCLPADALHRLTAPTRTWWHQPAALCSLNVPVSHDRSLTCTCFTVTHEVACVKAYKRRLPADAPSSGVGVLESHVPFNLHVQRVCGASVGRALSQVLHAQQGPAVVLHVQAVGGGLIT